jgi:para-nitrobenzyl esterase
MAVVETQYGRVEGLERSGVHQFRGIPFAAPPTGTRRWRAPQPPEPWVGLRDATEFGPTAPQPANRLTLITRSQPLPAAEDCLTLNAFTPDPGGDPRPVMVWIHGGGFTAGSGRDAWYNGASFARRGVVVVTLNYRLGALGFLRLEALPGSANCGLLDQVAALRWVRENIAAFGGDPGNVTAVGESAGGMSVGAMLGMPAAAGLFQRAIPQSGAASAVHTEATADDVAARMLARLGGLDGLLGAPADRIVETQIEVAAEMGPRFLAFRPTCDGVTLPRQPLDAVRDGSAASVALLTGTNRDEMTLFLAGSPDFWEADEERVVRRLEGVLPGRGRDVYDGYRSLLSPAARPSDVWVAAETDRVFRVPAIRLAEAMAAHGRDLWMYLFTWESPVMDGALRSCHALEIPFVWNCLTLPGTEPFTGAGPQADALAAEMHGSWVAFAEAGDPGWPRYDPERRVTRLFGPGPPLEEDPQDARRRLWDRFDA